MFNGGPELFEVLRRNTEEKRKKKARKGFLSWFGVQKEEETPPSQPEAPGLLGRIEQGKERIFATLPDESPEPPRQPQSPEIARGAAATPAPVTAPAPGPAAEVPKPAPGIAAVAPSAPEPEPAPFELPPSPFQVAPASPEPAAGAPEHEPAATAVAVAEPPPSPAKGRAKDIQFTLRAQNLVILCLVFTAMFMLSFVMGYQAGQGPSDPLAPEGADSSGMPAVSFNNIPTLDMSGRGRPPAVIRESGEERAPEGTAPEAAPIPVAANPPPLQGKYTLQVATYPIRERARAEALAGKLKASGVDSALYTVKGTRSDFVVVCAGTFASRSSGEAKAFERKVRDIREGGRALVSSATLWRSIPQPEVPGVHR